MGASGGIGKSGGKSVGGGGETFAFDRSRIFVRAVGRKLHAKGQAPSGGTIPVAKVPLCLGHAQIRGRRRPTPVLAPPRLPTRRRPFSPRTSLNAARSRRARSTSSSRHQPRSAPPRLRCFGNRLGVSKPRIVDRMYVFVALAAADVLVEASFSAEDASAIALEYVPFDACRLSVNPETLPRLRTCGPVAASAARGVGRSRATCWMGRSQSRGGGVTPLPHAPVGTFFWPHLPNSTAPEVRRPPSWQVERAPRSPRPAGQQWSKLVEGRLGLPCQRPNIVDDPLWRHPSKAVPLVALSSWAGGPGNVAPRAPSACKRQYEGRGLLLQKVPLGAPFCTSSSTNLLKARRTLCSSHRHLDGHRAQIVMIITFSFQRPRNSLDPRPPPAMTGASSSAAPPARAPSPRAAARPRAAAGDGVRNGLHLAVALRVASSCIIDHAEDLCDAPGAHLRCPVRHLQTLPPARQASAGAVQIRAC